jgi:hypothetical protein
MRHGLKQLGAHREDMAILAIAWTPISLRALSQRLKRCWSLAGSGHPTRRSPTLCRPTELSGLWCGTTGAVIMGALVWLYGLMGGAISPTQAAMGLGQQVEPMLSLGFKAGLPRYSRIFPLEPHEHEGFRRILTRRANCPTACWTISPMNAISPSPSSWNLALIQLICNQAAGILGGAWLIQLLSFVAHAITRQKGSS